MNSLTKHSRLIFPRLFFAVRFKGVKGGPEPINEAERQKPLYMKRYHEPKYLELLKPQIPFYELVNVKVQGYDYAVLEEYVQFIQRTAKTLKITQHKYWGVPAVSIRQDCLHHASELVSGSEVVKIHERTIQFKHMTSKICSLFLEAIQAGKPPLVSLHVVEHQPYAEEVRYIPDLLLKSMEDELADLKDTPVSVLGPVKKKK